MWAGLVQQLMVFGSFNQLKTSLTSSLCFTIDSFSFIFTSETLLLFVDICCCLVDGIGWNCHTKIKSYSQGHELGFILVNLQTS